MPDRRNPVAWPTGRPGKTARRPPIMPDISIEIVITCRNCREQFVAGRRPYNRGDWRTCPACRGSRQEGQAIDPDPKRSQAQINVRKCQVERIHDHV